MIGEAVIVDTGAGRVRGTEHDGVHRFLGIPYARADRFGAPHPVLPWPGVRAADAYGPMSPQVPGERYLPKGAAESEAECLSLNVWTPDPTPDPAAARPVMVWIHGGGFRQGASSSLLYDAEPLVRRGDVVVVTLNYRLGALGFLGHPDLGAGGAPAANHGLLDQTAALEWVRDHIGAFGGDPAAVTLFGESAGGASVSLLTVLPAARGLFTKAIAQSGAAAAVPMEVSARRAERLAAALDLGDVRALRDVPVDALVRAQAEVERAARGTLVYLPTIDGALVEQAPLAARWAGAAAGVPMVFGTNVDEWKLLGATDRLGRALDDEGLHRRLGRVLAGDVGEVVETFRRERGARGEPTAPGDLWFAIETDRFFRAPVLRDADAHAAHDDTWVYLFDWCSPGMRGWLGACHALEIAFVFGTQGRAGLARFTGSGEAADALSRHMIDAWSGFARTGDPSTDALDWPRHDPATRPTAILGPAPRVEQGPRDAERAVVDRHLRDPWT